MGNIGEHLEEALDILGAVSIGLSFLVAKTVIDDKYGRHLRNNMDHLRSCMESAKKEADHELTNLKLARPRIKELEKKVEEAKEKEKWADDARKHVLAQRDKYLNQLKNVRDDGTVRCMCCGHDEENIIELYEHMHQNQTLLEEDRPIREFEVRSILFGHNPIGKVRLCFWCYGGLINQIRYDMIDEQREFFDRSSLDIRKKLMELVDTLGGVPREEETP